MDATHDVALDQTDVDGNEGLAFDSVDQDSESVDSVVEAPSGEFRGLWVSRWDYASA